MKKPICPNCKTSQNVSEIVYGLPSREPREDENVILGGCMIFEGQPNWVCTKCDWDDSTPPYREEVEGL